MKKLLALAAAVGFASIFALASPAAATQKRTWTVPNTASCKTTEHTFAGFLLTSNGEPATPENPNSGATATLKETGVELSVPGPVDKALYLTDGGNATLAQIGALSFKTWQLNPGSVALPSYQLQIDRNGGTLETGDFTTLVYEPYMQPGFNNPLNAWKLWDAINDGNAKWWSTKPLSGLPDNADQGHPQKWADILTAYPAATVLRYGANLGKGSPGAKALLDELKFGTTDKCELHKWHKPAPKPPTTPPSSPATSPTYSASPAPSGSVNPHTSPSSSTAGVVPVSDNSTTLPVTGSKIPAYFLVGVGLLAAGIVIRYATRKRKTAFITE